jgi:hypothetical protein
MKSSWQKRAIFLRVSLVLGAFVAAMLQSGFSQPNVQVTDVGSVGPRTLEKPTRAAVVRDYLNAWSSLTRALGENRVDVVDEAFVGIAKEKLAETVKEQKDLGMTTRYRETSHDIKLLFYSPEGLSIQLADQVEYEVQVLDHDRVQAVQQMHARYVAVLTPTELRWKVRVLQALPD